MKTSKLFGAWCLNIKFVIGAWFLVLGIFLTPSPAFAQSVPLGLSIDPPIFEAIIKPGKSITQVFTIQNLSDSPRTLTAKIIPFEAGPEDGYPVLKLEAKPVWLSYFSLANSYISLNKPFNLRAKQTEQLVLNINIPNNATSQDLYANLYLSSEGNLQDQLNGPNLGMAIGANLLISTSFTGNPPANISIESFNPIEKDVLLRYGDYYVLDNLTPIRFQALAKNNGKHYTKTGGAIKILNSTSDIISAIPLAPLNLLAGGTRIVQASESGQPTFAASLRHIGTYKAILEIKNDNGSAKSEITLLILPLKVALGALLVLVLFIFIFSRKNTPKAIDTPK